MTTQFGPTDEQVQQLAEQMHDTGLGCKMGDWGNPETGEFGHGCIADHEAQARALFGAMLHEHPTNT